MKDEISDTDGTDIDRQPEADSDMDDSHTSRRAVLKGAIGASVVLGFGVPGITRSLAARDGFGAGEEASANIVMPDQRSDGNVVVAESVRLPDGGYVGIHTEQLLSGDVETSMIGVSDYLESGDHEAVAVDLFELEGIYFETGNLDGDQPLLASPHRETNKNEVNEFARTAGEVDGPYTSAGAPVVDIGHVTVEVDGDVATVSFGNQRADGETVTVDSATLTDGGFVALHDATTFRDDLAASILGVSDYLGYGIHTDVDVRLFADVEIDSSTGSGLPLVAVPHHDTNGNEAFDFVESGGDTDGPYVSDGRPVTDVGFVVST